MNSKNIKLVISLVIASLSWECAKGHEYELPADDVHNVCFAVNQIYPPPHKIHQLNKTIQDLKGLLSENQIVPAMQELQLLNKSIENLKGML